MNERPNCFSEALQMLKDGYYMRRSGWNGSGMCVQLVRPGKTSRSQASVRHMHDTNHTMLEPFFVLVKSSGSGDNVKRTANTWVPSVSDLLAEDWEEAP